MTSIHKPVAAGFDHARPEHHSRPSASRRRCALHVLLWIVCAASTTVVAGAAAAPITPTPTATAETVRLSGHVLPVLTDATPQSQSWLQSVVSSTSGDATNLALTVVLKRDDEEGFQQYLHEVYDPQSPMFRKFMSPAEIAQKFGPSQQTYDDVQSWLATQNLQLTDGSVNRMTLSVRGVHADVERAFAININNYALGEHHFYANDAEPAVPAAVAEHVQFISGLSNLATPHAPRAQRMIRLVFGTAICSIEARLAGAAFKYGAGPGSTYNYYAEFVKCFKGLEGKDPAQMLAGSDPPPPAWQDADGTGQTVGLVQFDTFTLSDVADYIDLLGLPASKINDITQVHVNGGAGTTPGANQDEVLLDIDAVLTLAPGAKIAVYDAPFGGANASFQAVFNAMIGGGVNIISNSWSYCEDQTTLSDVQSIDSILQSAAASGISVLNASGDSGSTCLDGSPNTVGVPADSPSATAVGGTSLTQGPGRTYASETWWDGTSATPPSGRGGFGVSKFFTRPSYQNSFTSSAMRSVPDVAVNADPAHGVVICNASEGGCPTGALNGGTSLSAPTWAAFTALLNQTQGSNLGALNPSFYPLAASGFRSAASMGSDFAHVGLGSPKLAMLHQQLTHQTTGAVDASVSQVWAFGDDNLIADAESTNGLVRFDDGVNKGYIVVTLADANGNLVIGKTVKLTANAGSHAVISPAAGIATDGNGVALFSVIDQTQEPLVLTATDTTDAIVLTKTAGFDFIVAPAASGGIVAFTDTVAADGVSTNTITVTLQDSLGRPTPGKQITLVQTGNSVIKGPDPGLTNASGQIQFVVTDTVQQNVTYTAIDATDGGLPVPGAVTVTFNAGGGDNCGSSNFGDPNITAADGYAITPYATGFLPKVTNFGGLNDGCRGASALAFDTSGNLFVSDLHTGNIYKFASGGGVAGAGTLITPTPLGPGIETLAFGKDGKLYAAQNATTGNFFTGAVLEINPSTGAIVRTVASSITCASFLVTDPFSGDLFVDDSCGGGGSDNASIWRIANPGSSTPTTSIYAATTDTNGGLSFGPGGTLYVIDYYGTGLSKVTGTTAATPGQVTQLTGITGPALDILAIGAQGNGDAKTLIASTGANTSLPAGMKVFDATTTPITPVSMLVNNAYATVNVMGPDGCLYAGMIVAVYKITNADGSCPLSIGGSSLNLTPTSVAPNPTQGTAQNFTASFHHLSVPAGTSVNFFVTGANPQRKLVTTDANGNATLTYKAINAGTDTIVAQAIVGGTTLTSNNAHVTWAAGAHTTALSLNSSAIGGTASSPVAVSASLIDVSASPPSALASQQITFSLGSANCAAQTNASGIASCTLTLGAAGSGTLLANFAGTASYLPSSDSSIFNTQTSAGFVGFVPLVPARLLDTRTGSVTIDGQFAGTGALIAQSTRDLTVLGRGNIPNTGVDAVVLNVTVAAPSAQGFLTVWPSGSARPLASNLNFVPNEIVPNLVIAKLGANGKISMFNSAGSTNVIADVVGYFTSGSDLTSLVPERLLDTRTGAVTIDTQFAGIGALQAQSTLNLVVAGRPNVPASGVSTVVLNVTATNTTAAGFITVWPTGSARPLASNLNYFAPGQTIPNLVVAQVGTGGKVSLFNSAGSTDLIADIVGWLPATAELTSLVPARLLDTRAGSTTIDGLFAGAGALAPASAIDLTVTGRGNVPASGVGAVILNVTATNPTAASFLTVWPTGSTRPLASNLNVTPGTTIPNLVFAKVGTNGKVSIFNAAGSTDVVADVVGWFPPAP